MTAAQATQIAKGVERAQAEGVKVLARGTDKRTGTRFFLVRGSTGIQYTVAVLARRLSCTCPAGARGTVCKHRSLIHDVLAAELRASAQTEVERGSLPHETAMPAYRLDNRPVSMWK